MSLLSRYYLDQHLKQENFRFQQQAMCVGEQQECLSSSESTHCEIPVQSDTGDITESCEKNSVSSTELLIESKLVTSYVNFTTDCGITQDYCWVSNIEEIKVVPQVDWSCRKGQVELPRPEINDNSICGNGNDTSNTCSNNNNNAECILEKNLSCDVPVVNVSKRAKYNNYQMLGGLVRYPNEKCVTKSIGSAKNRLLIPLNRPYQHIVNVKIVSSVLPVYDTIINAHNSQIFFQLQDAVDVLLNCEGQDYWTFDLPHGNYSIKKLGHYLITQMNQLVGEKVCDCDSSPVIQPFSYELDSAYQSFAIKTRDPYTFTMKFGGSGGYRSLDRMLGYASPEQLCFTDCWENCPSLGFNFALDRTLLIKSHVEEFNQIYDCQTKSFYFSLIPLTDCDFSVNNHLPLRKYLNNQHIKSEVIIKDQRIDLDYLDFSFFNGDGHPINLNRLQLSITLEISECLKQIQPCSVK